MNVITTAPSQLDNRTLVFAEGQGFLGYIRPLGSAFQVQDASGRPVALKARRSQAEAHFKYAS